MGAWAFAHVGFPFVLPFAALTGGAFASIAWTFGVRRFGGPTR